MQPCNYNANILSGAGNPATSPLFLPYLVTLWQKCLLRTYCSPKKTVSGWRPPRLSK